MRRFLIAGLSALMFLPLAVLSGCGEDQKTGEIVLSPEAKKADATGQDAMKEFMKTKPKGKSVSPKVSAPAPTPAPAAESK